MATVPTMTELIDAMQLAHVALSLGNQHGAPPTTTTTPTATTTKLSHPGGLDATQSLAFFRANNINGVLKRTRHRCLELRVYTCMTTYLDGTIATAEHAILAPRLLHHFNNL